MSPGETSFFGANLEVKVNGWFSPGPGWGEMEQEEKTGNYYLFSLSKGECVFHSNREQSSGTGSEKSAEGPLRFTAAKSSLFGKT